MASVLIIDDDPGVQRLARFALSSAGFEVKLAADGQEALDILHNEEPDVIVLDLNMPVMDGYTFMQHLGEARRPRILILSGENAEKARQALGADASMRKPFIPEVLTARVTELSVRSPS